VGELRIGQQTHEYGAWVHTGVSVPRSAVNRVITISLAGTRSGVHET
jgi:hypothetical protein